MKKFLIKHKVAVIVLLLIIVSIILIKVFMGFYFPWVRSDWSFMTKEHCLETWGNLNNAGKVTAYDGDSSVVVVPKFIDGERVTTIDGYAFDYNPNGENIRTIIIPEGVKKIDSMAFIGCENLETIYLPLSIEEISYGFMGLKNYSSLNVISLNPLVNEEVRKWRRGDY